MLNLAAFQLVIIMSKGLRSLFLREDNDKLASSFTSSAIGKQSELIYCIQIIYHSTE